MKKTKPTYRQIEKRLSETEPIIAALKRHEFDAVVGEEKIAYLLLRKVEEAWLESHGEFSTMFQLGGIGMILAQTPAFRLTRVNPKFCEIAGFSSDELLERTFLDLTHPRDRTKDLKSLARVLRGEVDAWSNEKRCIRKDGSVIWVSVHGAAMRDQAGRTLMIVAMIEDITARRQMERQLRDTRLQLKQQLRERTADASRLLRTLRSQVAKRKPAGLLLKTIQNFLDRPNATKDDGAPEARPTRRTKASPKKVAKSTTGKSSGKSSRKR